VTINLKRAYEPSATPDGYRVLVDRLWPRGISKEKANIGLWLKDVAPSDELRKWFGHDPERWLEFRTKYRHELASRKELLKDLRRLEAEHTMMTLVYAAKDETRSNAVVLKDLLDGTD